MRGATPLGKEVSKTRPKAAATQTPKICRNPTEDRAKYIALHSAVAWLQVVIRGRGPRKFLQTRNLHCFPFRKGQETMRTNSAIGDVVSRNI